MSPIIHIVDDDESLRTALTRLLFAAGFETRAYASAGDFLDASVAERPGCVLVDLCLPGSGGLELQEALANRENALPLIFLSGHGDVSSCACAMKGGAVDFLTKPVQREVLLDAIRRALARNQLDRAARTRQRAFEERYETLTQREREVFALVVTGLMNKQVAAALGASERTVKAHRARVMEKIGVDSLAALVRAADQLQGSMQTSAPPVHTDALAA